MIQQFLLQRLWDISWISLAIVLIMGIATNGAKRWIDLGIIQFQPSELGKMATIITVAFILSKMYTENGEDKKAFRFILGVTGGTCALIITENLSTAVLLAVSVYVLMLVARIPFKQMAKLTGIGIIGIILAFSVIWCVPASAWKAIGIERPITWKERISDFSNNEQIPAV